ncbi:bifunctional adenosylcobinamide kinase/adenosylcobinamide-phosphate guanylyltransferase [Cohnella fermenti]|uniref:Adenosylcobinamide kinase n=1 Tax=Cohnella fermenti TaxID=2565925 RepID=A0A4S4BK11_9BACL|nr:bifunctional adenosylcobinamide kinase/adenosylcobinamide-phosphate guanylyltransferase [Cohnella fermenti]THF74944.1 bifunctional adenosylcobinamide kinase/adenosylcobinamide-phosphate guanylyltransferase [Cohnella fermenti]
MIVLITGGARSGKSAFAERYAEKLAGDRGGVYVATAQALDEGMRRRIDKHRASRESSAFRWETAEEPLEAAELLDKLAAEEPAPLILLDCLTLWLTNVLLEGDTETEDRERTEERVMRRIEELVGAFERYPGTALLVTNEVGDGIVPEHRLGRIFRDYAGVLNQRVASISEEVFLVTAGIPVELKRLAYRWPE